MKTYEKPNMEFVGFVSETITDDIPGVEGGDTSNKVNNYD